MAINIKKNQKVESIFVKGNTKTLYSNQPHNYDDYKLHLKIPVQVFCYKKYIDLDVKLVTLRHYEL